MFVQPASGDDGTALGAALHVQHLHEPNVCLGRMGLPLWGPEYGDQAISAALGTREDCASVLFDSFDELAAHVARSLAQGQIVGWFQGRMEFGPRALGCRSILADPRNPEMRGRINRLVKKREEFRPFAPAVSAEAAPRFFELREGEERTYAYMVVVAPVRTAHRSQLPAVTHVDGSARVQTVRKEDHPRFWMLLDEFGKITGVPILLNTSFNVRGQPIVRAPAEAIETFLGAGLDMLVIGNHVVLPRREARDRKPA
jgi:carbamoyltransferase